MDLTDQKLGSDPPPKKKKGSDQTKVGSAAVPWIEPGVVRLSARGHGDLVELGLPLARRLAPHATRPGGRQRGPQRELASGRDEKGSGAGWPMVLYILLRTCVLFYVFVLCVCLFVCLFACLFVCLFVCFFLCLFVCLFVSLFEAGLVSAKLVRMSKQSSVWQGVF